MYWSFRDLLRGDLRWKLKIAGRIFLSLARAPFRGIAALDRGIRWFEPWGILLAVIGLALSLVAFTVDYLDRVEERTVRAWQLLTTKAPGNSGKKEALEYLNKREGFFCGDNDCLVTLKDPTRLIGIDLSVTEGQSGAYLAGADLSTAVMTRANLSWANLHEADLSGAELPGAFLSSANLRRADLSGAFLYEVDLSKAYLPEADLRRANLFGADLRGAYLNNAHLSEAVLIGADLSETDLSGVRVLGQSQLDQACSDGGTKVPEGLKPPVRKCSESSSKPR